MGKIHGQQAPPGQLTRLWSCSIGDIKWEALHCPQQHEHHPCWHLWPNDEYWDWQCTHVGDCCSEGPAQVVRGKPVVDHRRTEPEESHYPLSGFAGLRSACCESEHKQTSRNNPSIERSIRFHTEIVAEEAHCPNRSLFIILPENTNSVFWKFEATHQVGDGCRKVYVQTGNWEENFLNSRGDRWGEYAYVDIISLSWNIHLQPLTDHCTYLCCIMPSWHTA